MHVLKIVALTIVAIIALFIIYVIYISSTKIRTTDLWSGNCGTNSDKLVIMDYYYENPLGSTYQLLFVKLLDSSKAELFRTWITPFSHLPFNIETSDYLLFPFKKDSNNMSIAFREESTGAYGSGGDSTKVTSTQYQAVRECISANKIEIEKSINGFKNENYNIVVMMYEKSNDQMKFENPSYPGTSINILSDASVYYNYPNPDHAKQNTESIQRQEGLGSLLKLDKKTINDLLKEKQGFLQDYTSNKIARDFWPEKHLGYSIAALESILKLVDTYNNASGQTVFQYRDAQLKRFKDVPEEYRQYK